MGMIRWLNRHRWGFPLLWAVPALLLAAVSRTWRVGAVLLIWIPLAIAVAWLLDRLKKLQGPETP